MSALVPTFREIRFQAMREKRAITATVLMSDDSVATVRFGPRGGHRKLKQES